MTPLLTHIQRYHALHGTTGVGHLYQGRFKSFPVQDDIDQEDLEHLQNNIKRGASLDEFDWVRQNQFVSSYGRLERWTESLAKNEAYGVF